MLWQRPGALANSGTSFRTESILLNITKSASQRQIYLSKRYCNRMHQHGPSYGISGIFTSCWHGPCQRTRAIPWMIGVLLYWFASLAMWQLFISRTLLSTYMVGLAAQSCRTRGERGSLDIFRRRLGYGLLAAGEWVHIWRWAWQVLVMF